MSALIRVTGWVDDFLSTRFLRIYKWPEFLTLHAKSKRACGGVDVHLITHANSSCMSVAIFCLCDSVCVCVYVCVHTIKPKQLKLKSSNWHRDSQSRYLTHQ